MINRIIQRLSLSLSEYIVKYYWTLQETKEIAEILYKHGCTWSLQTGNALGVHREKTIIRKNEDDLDIAVLAETWGQNIEKEIQSKGYILKYFCGSFEQNSEGVHIILIKRGLTIDIFPVFKGKWGNMQYRWYGGNHEYRYYFEPRLLENTRTVRPNGFPVEIPADTDAYLRAIYGDDYMIPNDAWDWRTQPKCRLKLPVSYLTDKDIRNYQHN